MQASRRTFFLQSVSGASLIALQGTSFAQAPTLVSEADPQAMALGYKADGSKTDTTKFPNYTAAQSCSGCLLFQGKATDSIAACAVFGSKQVSSKGWCSAWAKKP